MMKRMSIKGIKLPFRRKSNQKKRARSSSPEESRDSDFSKKDHHVSLSAGSVSLSESGAELVAEREGIGECADQTSHPSPTMKSTDKKHVLPPKGTPDNLSSSSVDIKVPQRKERGGLLGTLGRKIRASFRRKRDSSIEETYVSPSLRKNVDKKTRNSRTKPHGVQPSEKLLSSSSEEPSDSAIGVSGHAKSRTKQYMSVPSGSEKREIHSSCSSESCEHDNVLRCSKISVNIHSCDTSVSSDRNGHVVNLDKAAYDVNSLNNAEKPLNNDVFVADVVNNRTPQSVHTTPQKGQRTPCVLLSRMNPNRMNNGQPQPSSSGRKSRSVSDSDDRCFVSSQSAAASLEDVENKAPTVPPRPDLLSVSSTASTTSTHQRNINHAIFTHPSLGFGFGFALTGDCFEPYEGSPTSPLYDEVKDAPKIWSLTKELLKLSKFGWYWGPLTRLEAEEKLCNQTNGAFLVRDSSDDRYLLSLSFRSNERTLHTRIEHCNGMFSFYAQPESEGFSSIVDLIEHSMTDSLTGIFCYSRARTPGSPSYPVRLTKPISRFTQVRSLQYLCRFVIRQYTRLDHIQKLPLPNRIKGWLEENQY